MSKQSLKNIFSSKKVSRRKRILLGEQKDVLSLPDLNKIQLDSYFEFLQENVDGNKREDIGLESIFKSTFPFKSNDQKVRLEYDSYSIELPKFTIEECIEKDKTYAASIKAVIRLILEETEEIKEQEIYVCDMPYMTPDGTFIINGAERVVVSQIHRSPGVIFDFNKRSNLCHSRLIPERGPWLEFEIVKEVVYVRIDRKARIPVTTFFRAMGIESTRKILEMFYSSETIKLSGDLEQMTERLLGTYSIDDISVKDEKGERITIIEAGKKINSDNVEKLKSQGIKEIELIPFDEIENNNTILNTVERDTQMTQQEACIYIYTVVKGSEPTKNSIAMMEILRHYKCRSCETVFQTFDRPKKCDNCGASADKIEQDDRSLFFNPDNYNLGRVGRYKINKKFNYEDTVSSNCLEPIDIFETIKHLIKVRSGAMNVDDIDHLGNRRIRCVGEQLVNHLKVCFARMQRLAKERITIQDHDTLTPQNLLSIKPITAGVKEFFGTAQLSQFMDQTNPLSAITHKRRLNALGPGGLTRERAGFEVRDIHYTHYGRMCPIETPEGPNIGLIVSLASYAKINKYGFIETPYYKVKQGKVTDEVEYLSAIEEDRYKITTHTFDTKKDNGFKEALIPVRHRGNYPMVYSKEVNYMDVAPSQIISVSSSLIPFLEHDDANRALMGSNMQRQAVPLLFPDSPIVGTGVEEDAAKYSGFCVVSTNAGVVTKVDNAKIEITPVGKKKPDVYKLQKSQRTNQDTFLNQRPLVREGEKVELGQVISDGPSIQNGELALGKNVLTAFMTWEGYNYEDAVLMSENLVENDVYTSVHVEEHDVESRETKLGKEQITRDVPNITEEELQHLDDDGVVEVGTYIKTGSILVGKITPKGYTEITPEYKLLHSIFGEKARDVKDSSLRAPHGTEGTVIGIKRYSRDNRDDLKPGVIEKVRVYVAKKRKLKEGDKFAGRHGNKGIVARILPQEDMPFLPDGRVVDLVLNPLGVPSRMNIGQVYELVLGMVGDANNIKFATPVFNGSSYNDIQSFFKKSNIPANSRYILRDGRTGEAFKNPVTVGMMYYLKLHHLADDKVHARSTGPYSLVTQQPLGGKAQFGGQRVGEMEVWAIEAYGAANTLQEFLTVKADAMEGRAKIYESIVKGDFVSTPGIPESFNVLIQELRGLGLNIEIFDKEKNDISLTPKKKEKENLKRLI